MKMWNIVCWTWNPRTQVYYPHRDMLVFAYEKNARKMYDSMTASKDIAQIELLEETVDEYGVVLETRRIAMKDTAGEVEEDGMIDVVID